MCIKILNVHTQTQQFHFQKFTLGIFKQINVDVVTGNFTALLLTAKSWRPSKCLSLVTWLKIKWFFHTVEYCVAIKKNWIWKYKCPNKKECCRYIQVIQMEKRSIIFSKNTSIYKHHNKISLNKKVYVGLYIHWRSSLYIVENSQIKSQSHSHYSYPKHTALTKKLLVVFIVFVSMFVFPH